MIPGTIEANDRGLLLADGLFETLLWENGELDAFDAHAGRLARGCRVLRLAVPDPAMLRAAAEGAVAEAGLQDARAAVRLSWTAGSGARGLDRTGEEQPRLLAMAAAAVAPTGPARLVTVSVRRNEGSPASRLKSLSYLDSVLAKLEARDRGGDEALMLNNAGQLASGAASNLFWIAGGKLYTPGLDCGVLHGTMRARVLEAAASLGVEAIQVRAPSQALAGAEGVFLTSSLLKVREVTEVDGRPVPSSPLTARLSSRCR